MYKVYWVLSPYKNFQFLEKTVEISDFLWQNTVELFRAFAAKANGLKNFEKNFENDVTFFYLARSYL